MPAAQVRVEHDMSGDGIRRDAFISDDQRYRYSLTRIWDASGPIIAWVGLNPSTADHRIDDPTIRREMAFSRRWGYGGMIKVNMFGLRSANPHALTMVDDPIGPLNEATLWGETHGLVVIAAWGGSAPLDHHERIMTLAWRLRDERSTHVLGFTKGGLFPRHPLYVRADTDPTAWPSTPDPRSRLT